MPLSKIGEFAVAAVLASAAGGSLFAWNWERNDITLAAFLKSNGYHEVAPPSDFYAPGTLNTVETLGTGKLVLLPTCEVDKDALRSATRENPTISWQASMDASSALSAKISGILSPSASQKANGTVKVSLRDVSVLTMSEEALWNTLEKTLGGKCQEVIAQSIKNGGTVCQTSGAIKADLVYRISFNEGVAVEEQSRIKKELREELKLQVEAQGENEIIGKGLFFGIRLHPLAIIPNVPDAAPMKCGMG